MSPRSRRAALAGCGILALLALSIPVGATLSADSDAPSSPAPADRAELPVRPTALTGASDAAADAASVELDAHWADSYMADRVMAKALPGESLAAIASDHGGELQRAPGRSGYASILLPTGTHPGRAVEALRNDPRVAAAGPVGKIRGAGVGRPGDIQKKSHEKMGVWGSDPTGFSSIKVAVLDSGVAYENYSSGGKSYKKAYTFNGVSFVNPYDYVNNDAHPNDDHMHGTHIASLIASKKQVSGGMHGAAPGTTIMPIKVLDHNNEGNEMDLVDGIWHAVDNGAHIINMSLAFGDSYLPSAALQEALIAAYEAEIPTLAAAGNDAQDAVPWPAASHHVIAVGSVCQDGSLAPYANRARKVAVSTYGGCMDLDEDDDGFVDGALGETIVSGDPSKTQYVLWGGTSQATALASALVAQYMNETYVDEDDALAVLQDTAVAITGGGFDEGTGAGVPQRTTASFINRWDVLDVDLYRVSVLPYLHRESATTARPAAVISLGHYKNEAVTSGTVHISVKGSTTESGTCEVSAGQCIFKGDLVDLVDGAGDALPLGWSIQVEAFERFGGHQIIEPSIYVTDGLEVFAKALDDSDAAGLPVGVYWPENRTPATGVRTSEAYAWTDSGSGFASSPLGVLFTPSVFPSSAMSSESLDLDGTGFSSSPLGTMSVKIIEFGGVGFSSSPLGGVGFASSPLGLSHFKMAVFDGVGFSSSPLGLDAFDIWAPGGSTIDIGGVGFASSPLGLSTGGGVSIGGTNVGALMSAGGWTIGSGEYPAGTALLGATMVDTTPSTVGSGGSDGWDSIE